MKEATNDMMVAEVRMMTLFEKGKVVRRELEKG
jgi:hypothetical protein